MDEKNGGFYLTVDYNLHPENERILILNSRMIWGFSAIFRITGNKKAEALAHRAYEWFMGNMWDKVNSGAYYFVSYLGKLVDDIKWGYGQAFVIYAITINIFNTNKIIPTFLFSMSK